MDVLIAFIIGINVGFGIGWFLCKRFREDLEEFMERFVE